MAAVTLSHTPAVAAAVFPSLPLTLSFSLSQRRSLAALAVFFSCLLLRVLIQLNPVLIVDLMAANTAADIAAIVIVIIASCLAFFSFNLLAQIYKFMQPLIEN